MSRRPTEPQVTPQVTPQAASRTESQVRSIGSVPVFGIVVKKKPFGEGHGQYRLLDRTRGIVEFAAFGASKERSRRRNALQTGSLVSGIVRYDPRRQYASLTEARLENAFEGIHADLGKLAYLMLILETLDVLLAEGVPFEDFDLLVETLESLDGGKRVEKYALVFLFGLLRTEGIFPEYSPQIQDVIFEFRDPDFLLGNGSLRFLSDTETYRKPSEWQNREISTSVIVNLLELLRLAVDYHTGKRLGSIELIRKTLEMT